MRASEIYSEALWNFWRKKEMLAFNEIKVLKKIIEDTGYDKQTAVIMVKQLKVVNEKLFPYITEWIDGKPGNFEFFGISTEEIMKKENSGYIQAVFRMSAILDNPESAERYKKRRFVRK